MKPKAFSGFPEELAARAPYGPYRAVVDTVHDGDTILIRADLGFGEEAVASIRLKTGSGEWTGAPELGEPGGPETRDYLAHLAPYETPCRVTTEKTPRSRAEQMSITRYVGEVELEGGLDLGTMINEFVADKGYGKGRT